MLASGKCWLRVSGLSSYSAACHRTPPRRENEPWNSRIKRILEGGCTYLQDGTRCFSALVYRLGDRCDGSSLCFVPGGCWRFVGGLRDDRSDGSGRVCVFRHAASMSGLVGSSINPTSELAIATVMLSPLLRLLVMGSGHPAGTAVPCSSGGRWCRYGMG